MDLRELLTSWGFDQYIDRFESNEIDIETIRGLYLMPEIISELIPLAGPRIKFIQRLKQYVSGESDMKPSLGENQDISERQLVEPDRDEGESGVDEESREGTDGDDELVRPSERASTSNERNTNVQNSVALALEENSVIGQIIIQHYDTFGCFDNSTQRKLVDLLITLELQKDTERRISSTRFEQLAEEIHAVFPNEIPTVYYIKRSVVGNQIFAPKGKLYNKYVNYGKALRKSGQRESDVAESNVETTSEAAIDAALLWLSTHKDPWDDAVKNWRITTDKRIKSRTGNVTVTNKRGKRRRVIKDKENLETILDYFNKFAVLKQPLGYTLLEMDFNHMYPNLDLKLFEEWPEFKRKLNQVFHINVDNEVQTLTNLINLFEPTTINGKEGKKWRPNRVEMTQGFILHVFNISDMESSIDRIRAKLIAVGKTLQPLVIVVGKDANHITDSYVALDQHRYRVESPLRAMDVCFKSIHSLHACYPVQCEAVWLFFQKAIYKMKTPWDKPSPEVSAALHKLSSAS